MTTHFKHFLSVFAISIFIILALASTSVKRLTFTTENGQMPPNFYAYKDTLLVIAHKNEPAYNKYSKKYFEEFYTGKFKIIKQSEIENYSTDKYRYMFDRTLYSYSKTTTTSIPITGGGHIKNGGSSTFTHTFAFTDPDRFFITDRKIKKDYLTKPFGNYLKLIKVYIIALENERQR